LAPPCERQRAVGPHVRPNPVCGHDVEAVLERAHERGLLRELRADERLREIPVTFVERRAGREAERRRGLFSRFLNRPEPVEAAVSPPILRRLSSAEQATVEAADLFNASQHRRTVEGLTRSLGWPQVSIVPLSGVNPEVVITVCWEISWYQYRIAFDPAQPIRLAQRGHDPNDLESSFTTWNAQINDAGLIVPELPED
jgi:hypothetical protein